MRETRPFSILGLGCGPDAAERLRIQGVDCRFTAAATPDETCESAGDHEVVVLAEGSGHDPAELARRIREEAPETLVVLIRPRGAGVPTHPERFDDILVRTRTREVQRRLGDVLRIGRMRRRFRASGLEIETVRAVLDELGLSGALVDEGGIRPPARLRLASLQDVRRLDRHQRSICELMGTAFATFRYDHEPRPLRDAAGLELTPTGTLAPYCAYLKGAGAKAGNDRCLASDWDVARHAFATLRAAERTCDGGVGLYAVPITLRFGGITAPQAVLVVATGPLPAESAIEAAATRYGANADILRQMATESRFWALHPDKVSCLKETMRNLAGAFSLEVSHAYSTAYQTVAALLRETDLRRSEEQLADKAQELHEANERLERKHREIHDLTHNITHDLKKPLGAMKTMLSMLERGYLGEMSEKQMRAVDTASEAATYMIGLVNDLLDSSRLDFGTPALHRAALDAGEVVQRILGRMSYQIEENDITVEVRTIPRVIADEDALEKILMNLLGNAVSYIGEGPEKRISIGAELDGDRVRITVEDTGIGIPAACRSTIFDKFRRGTNVSNTSGTGLGLAIVKGLVEAHGGRIELDSEEGRGCRFRFDLAADRSPENDLHPPSDGYRYETVASGTASRAESTQSSGDQA